MLHLFTHHTKGQSLITVALFLVMLFAMTGFAIDGGLFYAQRRLMQNTADAACLAAANRLALGETRDQAETAAQTVVALNLGATPGTGLNAPGTLSYTAIAQLYALEGSGASGTDLTRGIEINGAEVRVALRSPAYTFFMHVIGVGNYDVAARTRCNSVAGGGATPFAVARWRGYYDATKTDVVSGLQTDIPLPQTYRKGKRSEPLVVRDILQQKAANTGICCANSASWPWQSGGSITTHPGDPASFTGLFTQASSAATPASSGYETVLAGMDANPNVGSSSFSGPIVLDLRNVTSTPNLVYNGLNPAQSLQKYKDLATRYILEGYPGPDVLPGQQLAYYSGVSAGQIQKPFNLRYNVGDIVTALIYNGQVYDKRGTFSLGFHDANGNRKQDLAEDTVTRPVPSSSIEKASNKCAFDSAAYAYQGTFTPKVSTTPSGSVSAAQYRLSITNPSAGSNNYTLRAMLSTAGSSFGVAEGRFGGSFTGFNSNGVGPSASPTLASGTPFNFDFQQNKTTTCTVSGGGTVYTMPQRVTGANTLYLEAKNNATGERRARYGFIEMADAASTEFFVYVPGEIVYSPMYPGDSRSFAIAAEKASGSTISLTSGDVSFSWFNAATMTSTTASGVTASYSKNKIDLAVSNAAAVNQEYYLRVQVKNGNQTRWAWYYVNVRPAISPSINDYVIALGYANFRITDIGPNSISGVAISGLLNNGQVKAGMQPRLLPWQ